MAQYLCSPDQLFLNQLEERMKKCRETLSIKGQQYATEIDRFHNFNRAAKILNTTPEKALLGFMMKHFVSVLDILEGIENGKTPDLSMWDEKLGDLDCYLHLLDGLVMKRINQERN